MRKLLSGSVKFLVLIALFSTCKDPYKFDTTPEFNVSFDGGIDDVPGPHYVSLGNTTYATQPPHPLTGCTVTITDQDGHSEILIDEGTGRYRLDSGRMTGVPGNSYKLTFQLPNGKSYHSTFEKLPAGELGLDSPYWAMETERVVSSEGVPIDNHLCNLYMNSKLAKSVEPNYYRWAVDEVYSIIPYCPPGAIACPHICYVFQPLSVYNILLLELDQYSTDHLDHYKIYSRGVDNTFNSQHYFNVTQYNINKGSYEYWAKIQDLVMKRGTLFDTPPAKIKGNVVNDSDPNEIVFGYFEASRKTISRTNVKRGENSIYVVNCYDYPERLYWPFCTDCMYLPGATDQMPSWWQ